MSLPVISIWNIQIPSRQIESGACCDAADGKASIPCGIFGCGLKLTRRGKPQVFSMCPLTRATHFGIFQFFEPQPFGCILGDPVRGPPPTAGLLLLDACLSLVSPSWLAELAAGSHDQILIETEPVSCNRTDPSGAPFQTFPCSLIHADPPGARFLGWLSCSQERRYREAFTQGMVKTIGTRVPPCAKLKPN